MSGSKYCPNCGKELESYVKICDYCGAKLDEKGMVLRSPEESDNFLSFCLLCLGIPIMIFSFIRLIDFYNQLNEDPEAILALGYVIIITLIPIIFCFLPSILLYLKGRKERKNT